jgi:hypothetical protein
VTRISTINGADGHELGSRIFPGAIALEYPGGNFTGDQVQDGLRGVYEIGLEDNNLTSVVQAVDGADRTELWNLTFADLAIALPNQDLTGDGLDDLLVYLVSNNTTNNALESVDMELAMIRGTDGKMLWKKSFGSSLPIAFPGPDMTGDGVMDLIVYRIGPEEEAASEVMALKGDDGSQLWSKSGMIFIPQ